MANVTKQKRDKMLSFIEELKKNNNDDKAIMMLNELENTLSEKKFGLVFEEHTEEVDEKLKENIPILCSDENKRICKDKQKPWNFIIEGDNLQALYLLEKTHRGKIDCIYIDLLIIQVQEIGNIITIMLIIMICIDIANGYQ